MSSEVHDADWINARSIFYNERTGEVSSNMNDVVDWSNLRIHKEGLRNYCEFGHTLFSQTLVEEVKCLPPNTRLAKTVHSDGRFHLALEELPDPAEPYMEQRFDSDEVIDRCRASVLAFEKAYHSAENYVLPMSGGYDSRFLASLLASPEKARAYTYGISTNQSRSYEVSNARVACGRLGIPWKRIPLTSYNTTAYIARAFDAFGASRPSATMYHMEFYERIPERGPIISGAIGDWWAGNAKGSLHPLRGIEDLKALVFTHGMALPAHALRDSAKERPDLVEEIRYAGPTANRSTEALRLFVIRARMRALNYLIDPAVTGRRKYYAPFLEPDIALPMLMLDPNESRDRLWQKRYFQRLGLHIPPSPFLRNYSNTLDITSCHRGFSDSDLLDPDLLDPYFDRVFLEKVNAGLDGLRSARRTFAALNALDRIPGSWSVPARRSFLRKKISTFETAYNHWTVIKPVELALQRARNGAPPAQPRE